MRRILLLLSLFALPLLAAETGQTFAANGVSIWYEVRGSGNATPLVVVNGGPGFDHAYIHLGDAVWDRLARTRRVVFYDQRGTGGSSPLKPGETTTLADQIADLEALRSHLGAEKIDLLGHSWGGYLVMAYAARHPKHVAHLAIVDSAAPKWGDTKFLFSEIFPETMAKQDLLNFADALGDEDATSEGIKLYMTMLFYSPEKRDAAQPQLAKGVYRKAVNEALNADVTRFDLNPELSKFTFPTLVATGRYDINVAPSVAWKIHKAIPGSQFAVFEKSGHIPFFEEPDAFAKALAAFLGE